MGLELVKMDLDVNHSRYHTTHYALSKVSK